MIVLPASASTFEILRTDIPKLSEAAKTGSRSVFSALLREMIVVPGETFTNVGYTLVFAFGYLEKRGIYLGSEYAADEHNLNSVASVGGYFLTREAFTSIDDLDPRNHDEIDIAWSIAQLGIKNPTAGEDGRTWIGILWDKLRVLGDEQALLVLIA